MTQVLVDEAAVAAALAKRDLCYGVMRRAVPDLEKPAAERAPLSGEQAIVVARFVVAEDRLRVLRTVTSSRDLAGVLG